MREKRLLEWNIIELKPPVALHFHFLDDVVIITRIRLGSRISQEEKNAPI